VLVHVGRHGEWCWRPVAALLRAAGHEVHTPTLTGLSERAHVPNPGSASKPAPAATIEFEDVHDLVLVGYT
jgi:hypothetical protein